MIDTIVLTAELVPVRCALERAFTDVSPDRHEPVVAQWDAGPLGRDYLCLPCLNKSLDYADTMNLPGFGTVGEPDALTWVMRPDELYCAAHRWPAVLCLSWMHGPGHDRFGQRDGRLHIRRDFPKPVELARRIPVPRWMVGE